MINGSRLPDAKLVMPNITNLDHPKPPTPFKVDPRTEGLLVAEQWIFFNRIPVTPLVTRTLVNYKPYNRGIWAQHVHKGWYVRSAMLNYLSLTSYIPKTDNEQVSNTTEFFPSTLLLQRISSKYTATHVDANLTHSLLNPTPTSPLTMLGNNQIASL